MLYGLNNYYLKCALEMSPDVLVELTEPQANAYTQAQ
jgi:hypothetical protein